MHLLHCLVFYAAFHRIEFVAEVLITAADAISHNNLFVSLVLQTRITIPQPVLDLLVIRRPDRMFTRLDTIVHTTGSQKLLEQFTSQDGNNMIVSFCSKF